jgi:hypothetical protein
MMSQRNRGDSRIPQVNLFAQPARGITVPLPSRSAEIALVAIAVFVWGAVGVGIAVLFGWHPPVDLGL